ncbi:hypothetical protein [Geminocystis sp. GBBB08]|uniref:hypothetical protein n=1 Tax=Geminocystis sp. GBBB08 TaxID=2604140 RepID=UPI0027E2B166|nr:hypothetical protein [Geminocystis sp. GBBB08]MBL1211642.1 hypothetical protein [Geminocystis sp. GBBB08]
MQVSNQNSWHNSYLFGMSKSFLIWTFTLTVCFLVVGFPLVVIMMTVGVLAAVVLQSILPTSAILLVSGSILGITTIIILLSSIFLTIKGIRPDEVQWLGWLHDKETMKQTSVYASCPLTCGINQI